MNPPRDSLLELANECLACIGYDYATNPWTTITHVPIGTDVPEALAHAEAQLDFAFPLEYRHFVIACSRNMLNNGFLVPWPSPRNIVAINGQLELPESRIAFWHEEDGALFCFSRTDDNACVDVTDEDGTKVADSYNEFLRHTLAAWITNYQRHIDAKRHVLGELADRLDAQSEVR